MRVCCGVLRRSSGLGTTAMNHSKKILLHHEINEATQQECTFKPNISGFVTDTLHLLPLA